MPQASWVSLAFSGSDASSGSMSKSGIGAMLDQLRMSISGDEPIAIMVAAAVATLLLFWGLASILARALDAGRRRLDQLGGELGPGAVSYTHLRAHETRHDLVCR